MTVTTELTAARIAIAAEIARLNEMERTEHVGRVISLDITADDVTLTDSHPNYRNYTFAHLHGTTVSVSLPDSLTPAACAEFVSENAAEIAAVMEGMSSEWDGSNMRGLLTVAASDALDELRAMGEHMCEDACYLYERGEIINQMDASDFYADIRSDIAAADSEDAAAVLVLECLDADGIADAGNGMVWIDREQAERYAREMWQDAREDEDAA